MADEYIAITSEDGETFEFLPTDALLGFLQRMAEDEAEERGATGLNTAGMETSNACTRESDISHECQTKG